MFRIMFCSAILILWQHLQEYASCFFSYLCISLLFCRELLQPSSLDVLQQVMLVLMIPGKEVWCLLFTLGDIVRTLVTLQLRLSVIKKALQQMLSLTVRMSYNRMILKLSQTDQLAMILVWYSSHQEISRTLWCYLYVCVYLFSRLWCLLFYSVSILKETQDRYLSFVFIDCFAYAIHCLIQKISFDTVRAAYRICIEYGP